MMPLSRLALLPRNAWLLGVALVIHIIHKLSYFEPGLNPFDVSVFFVPLAKRLMAEGLGLFTTPQSVEYSPLSFIYIALFGGNTEAVKIANIILSCLLLLMLYRIGTLIHSKQAGIIAAFLFALSPALGPLIPAALTEPLYIFFCGTWIWALIELLVRQRREMILVGGISFGLAILTRGTYIYLLYVLIGAGLLLALKPQSRRVGGDLALTHFVALLFPLVFMIKNWILFNFPEIYGGTGNALYLGSHPLFRGFDAGYFGLVADGGSITQSLTHHSIEGGRALKAVALTMLKERDKLDLGWNYIQKLSTFLFVSKVELVDSIFNLRSLRVAEVVLSVVGLIAVQNRTVKWLLGAAVGYQIVVHIPILTNFRYSVGSIELWLIILSAVGISALLSRVGQHLLATVLVVSLIIAGIIAGEIHRQYSPPFSPDIFAQPAETYLEVWRLNDFSQARISGSTPLSNKQFILSRVPASFFISVPNSTTLYPHSNYVLTLELTAVGECKQGKVFYKRHDDREYKRQSMPVFIRGDGIKRYYHIGAREPLNLTAPGELQLRLSCVSGTTINFSSAAIYELMTAPYYLARTLGRH